MLTCQQASELVSQSLDQPLSLKNRFTLKFHLMMCSACHRFNRQMRQLRSAILGLVKTTENDESITLSPEAKAKISQKLSKDAS
jgi:predicted anti-sigma-YlaC factor YlaD